MPITVLGACSYSLRQPFLSRHATILPIFPASHITCPAALSSLRKGILDGDNYRLTAAVEKGGICS